MLRTRTSGVDVENAVRCTASVASLAYSYRSARIGSMRLARCAGIRPAAADMTRQHQQRRSRIHGSCGWIPYSCVADETSQAHRRGHADGESDREQHQHFSHDEPHHDARVRAERQPDAELLASGARRRTP